MAKGTCSIDGCGRKHQARGWCATHYLRWYKHGDPLHVPPTAMERFYSNSMVVQSGCSLWTGRPMKDGYGRFMADGRHIRVHRFSYEHYIGIIPAGMDVCHTCDVPLCVYPGHFFLGDAASNAADKIAKGRDSSGEKHGNARLTADAVREIRRLAASGVVHSSIAARFGIERGHVSNIVKLARWKNVE